MNARDAVVAEVTDLLWFILHQAMTNSPPTRDYLYSEVEAAVDRIMAAI